MKIKYSKPGFNLSTAFVGLYSTFILEKVYFIAQNELLLSIIDLTQWLFLLYFAYRLLHRHYSMKLLSILLVVIILFGISYYECKASEYLKFALIIVASFGVVYDGFYRDIRHTYLILVIPFLILGILGLIPSTVVRRGYSTFGFIHSNVIAMFALSAICCYVLEKKGRLSPLDYVCLLLIDVIVFLLTNTRSSCAMIVVLLVTNMLLKTSLFNRAMGTNFFKAIILMLIPAATVFSFYLAMNYNSGNILIAIMNKITSNRIYMANIVVTRMHPALFGNYVTGDLVENAYIISIYQYGLVATVGVYLFYSYALKKAIDRRDSAILAVLICFIIHGIIEGVTFEPFVNVALVPTVFGTSFNELHKRKKV